MGEGRGRGRAGGGGGYVMVMCWHGNDVKLSNTCLVDVAQHASWQNNQQNKKKGVICRTANNAMMVCLFRRTVWLSSV